MHPSHWAEVVPDAPAIVMAASGETVSFAALEDAANRGAHLLRRLGLKRGDVIAVWSGNNARFIEIAWVMMRTGVYMVPVPSRLHAHEAAYIIDDCGARVLIIDATVKHAAALASNLASLCPKVEHAYTIQGDLPGLEPWEAAIASMPASLIDDPSRGHQMIYSSGTTGQQKGVQFPLPEGPWDEAMGFARMMIARYGAEPGMKFMINGPMYHSGPFAMGIAAQSMGMALLIVEKFDAEAVLAAIERYRPEIAQFAPTMFVRLLKLPRDVRERYDLSSLKVAIHAAAPCPLEAKREMIAWWGPILDEMYGGSENVGGTIINSEEWLRKPGSVGRSSAGALHICDEHGRELPVGESGIVYFEGVPVTRYLNQPEKTLQLRHPLRSDWATFGDIGHVDEDGYLFLSDRRDFMVISGGVNIYPQELENLLSMHPEVADVTAFGVPDPDWGERLLAVVQPVDWLRAGPQFEAELIAWCKQQLATLKCPKAIEFVQSLERNEAGKIPKRALRDRYWPTGVTIAN
jgi:acyl-CoA synthetase (AMP-forming)/AMP-acid ligase II